MQRLYVQRPAWSTKERSARPRYRTRKNQKQHTAPPMMYEWHRRSLSTVSQPNPSRPTRAISDSQGQWQNETGTWKEKRDKKTKCSYTVLKDKKEKTKI